jgi:hypothetical protein
MHRPITSGVAEVFAAIVPMAKPGRGQGGEGNGQVIDIKH